jgi:exopolyphosphatase/guanosine-5'-triphosphate,3'-diphosphate pyrophosphatase
MQNKTNIELFKYDGAGGVNEYHVMIHVTDLTLNYKEQVEALQFAFNSLLQGEVKGASPVFKRYFLSDAANQADFSAMLQAETGLELEICSGAEEAALSFFGATDGGDSGVIDIGGGSTEVIVGHGMDVRCGFSCQMGAVRLAGRIPIRDHGDLAAVQTVAADILEHALRDHSTLSLPKTWRGTGGTFTTLAAMMKGIHWTERTYMHGTVLTKDYIQRIARDLADMPLEERKLLPGLQPNRADIIVHGICILLSCLISS